MKPPLDEAPASAFLIFLVQVFLLFCLFFALIYDVAEMALFALIILAMGLGSYLWTRVSLHQTECNITADRTRLFPGETLKIKIRALNAKFLPILFKVHLFVPGAVAGSEAGQWISEERGLLWFQQTVIVREFAPNRRGVFDFGLPRVRGGDLFGFFFRHQAIKEPLEVVVYPRIVNIRSIAIPKREFFGIPGSRSPVEDPVFVFGTREYQPGRPARGIHWKASARYNRLQEKLCEPAEQQKVLIVLDVAKFEPEAAHEAFERSLEVIASLILQMNHRGIAVGFATNGKIHGKVSRIIPISRSHRQMASALEVLARMDVIKVGSVTDVLARGYKLQGGVSGICFGYHWCRQTRAAKAFLNHRNVPVCFVMARKSSAFEAADDQQEKDTFYLDDIVIQEIADK